MAQGRGVCQSVGGIEASNLRTPPMNYLSLWAQTEIRRWKA
jgi:hypothetical protein